MRAASATIQGHTPGQGASPQMLYSKKQLGKAALKREPLEPQRQSTAALHVCKPPSGKPSRPRTRAEPRLLVTGAGGQVPGHSGCHSPGLGQVHLESLSMETRGVVQGQGRIPPPTGCHFRPIPRSSPKKIPLSRPEGFQTWPQTAPQEGGVTGRQGQPLSWRRAGKSLTMQFAARLEGSSRDRRLQSPQSSFTPVKWFNRPVGRMPNESEGDLTEQFYQLPQNKVPQPHFPLPPGRRADSPAHTTDPGSRIPEHTSPVWWEEGPEQGPQAATPLKV